MGTAEASEAGPNLEKCGGSCVYREGHPVRLESADKTSGLRRGLQGTWAVGRKALLNPARSHPPTRSSGLTVRPRK